MNERRRAKDVMLCISDRAMKLYMEMAQESSLPDTMMR
jgi:hypothetical protein